MFFSVFWTAYIPVTLIILSLVGERLKQFLRESGAHAWVTGSGPRRQCRSCVRSRPTAPTLRWPCSMFHRSSQSGLNA
jgi:hypothetical protein